MVALIDTFLIFSGVRQCSYVEWPPAHKLPIPMHVFCPIPNLVIFLLI